ncbi:MAG: site-specific DNA-methyltransferase [Thermodesulfobacteriota bacterium]|nr:site-specific DNA-methyltransferase [Thermodesulfobacteriota bacterium]
METFSRVIFDNSNTMDSIDSESVDLIVTSPPYPMIKMWDEMFCRQNRPIRDALKKAHGMTAFELMHQELDRVWKEVFRVLKNGGFACINIGDAVRTIGGDFCLYPNHARILHFLQGAGFSVLPDILWRKQTNAPNKFMGSGMLPAGAYVTLEHEFILIARKGPKRNFSKKQEKRNRHESAFFWEERNVWFSDIWFDVKGASQVLGATESRTKSAAFPFEVAYRLINMYSVKEDVVLDPFLGTGTTMAAAMASGRNSIGFEIDVSLCDAIAAIKDHIVDFSNQHISNRIERHIDFAANWIKTKGPMKHINKYYQFPVITAQETQLMINHLLDAKKMNENTFKVTYSDKP